MPHDRRTGWLLAAGGMLLVSTDSFFVRLSEADAIDFTFLVAVFSLPVLLVLNRRFERIGPIAAIRADPLPLLGVAVLAGISQTAFIAAITRTDVANAVAIVGAAPVVAAIVARLVIKERTATKVWIAIGITMAGIAVIVSGSIGSPNLDGDLLAVVAIVSFAVSITIWRSHPYLSRFVGLALSTVIVIVATALFASPFSLEPRTYAAAAAMGLVFSPAGRLLHSNAPRFAPASEVALFTPVETIAATVWAWAAFAEAPSTNAVLGGSIIIAGVILGTVGTSDAGDTGDTDEIEADRLI